MDEIREQMDIANEINDAISQPLGGEMFDEVCTHPAVLSTFDHLYSWWRSMTRFSLFFATG